jgi:hypothetical protein
LNFIYIHASNFKVIGDIAKRLFFEYYLIIFFQNVSTG